MSINKNVFITDEDRAALAALKAVPGFEQLVSAFMKVWSEKLLHIENMASKVRLSKEQLPHYYEMLLPICDKLGIDVPELYLELNPSPNAYTMGNVNASITITSGLIETIPDELMPTVLAHECGHIACHHVLYRTMGVWLMRAVGTGILDFLPIPAPLANAAWTSILAAFAYWMRCSEYSADRAAVLCDGTPDKTFELCLRLSGFDKDILHGEANLQAFFDQAREYKEHVEDNAANRLMEFYLFMSNDHPVNALRALGALEWSESDDFQKSKEFFESYRREEDPLEFPIGWNSKHFVGRPYEEVAQELSAAGFNNVQLNRKLEKTLFAKEGAVQSVLIDGEGSYIEGEWYRADAAVEVTYYLQLTEEETAAMHVDDVKLDRGLKSFVGKPCEAVRSAFEGMGFTNIVIDEVKDITKEKDKSLGKVAAVTIDKSHVHSKGDWVPKDALVEIVYHSLV